MYIANGNKNFCFRQKDVDIDKHLCYDFYKDIWSSEEGQLNILSGYLKGSGIVPYMKSKNFQEIARRYNGPGYKQNGYDTKLKAAYEHP